MVQWFTFVAAAASCLRATHGEWYEPSHTTEKPINIAIIGAGAGGASTAFHLNRFAAAANLAVNITIFERNPYIGGRSTTINAYDDSDVPVELGASIFVQVNKILKSAVDEFGLSTSGYSSNADIPGPALAVWNGEEFVFTQQGEGGWWDIVKLFWKYGLAPYRTIQLMKSVVGKFLKMYDEPYFPFESLTQVTQDVGLRDVTVSTGEQFLEQNGITVDFRRDIVQASTRVNYAQNLRYIHGLEAMVCMATDNAMSVEGGNWQIFEGMVNASKATAKLSTSVTGLEKQDNSSYLLTFETTSKDDYQTMAPHPNSQLFDAVVLAAPYQFANLSLTQMSEDHHVPDKIPYVTLHVTLFTSTQLYSPVENITPRVILTTLRPFELPLEGARGVGSPGIWSLSILRTVTNPSTGAQEYLYKVFSPWRLDDYELSNFLGPNPMENVTWIYRKEWQSYPYEYPRVTFEEIKLDENLWYTSGIESFISTMETSALMGKNVARLVVDEWLMNSYFSMLGKAPDAHVAADRDLWEHQQVLRDHEADRAASHEL